MQLLENKQTMTSLELVEQINIFRAVQKEKEPLNRLYSDTSHDSLLKVIREEFSEEINESELNEVDYLDKKGERRPCFNLTHKQAKQILVKESKVVRKAVIAYIERLENELIKPISIEDALIQQLLLTKNIRIEQEDIKKRLTIIEGDKQLAIQQLNYIERSTEEVPEVGLRLRISQIVRAYQLKTGIPHQEIWNSMYNKMLYAYHFNVNAHKKTHDKELKIEIIERLNQIDNLYALVSKELV
jgi:hypothetical protein